MASCSECGGKKVVTCNCGGSCYTCGGDGKHTCPTCNGTGRQE